MRHQRHRRRKNRRAWRAIFIFFQGRNDDVVEADRRLAVLHTAHAAWLCFAPRMPMSDKPVFIEGRA